MPQVIIYATKIQLWIYRAMTSYIKFAFRLLDKMFNKRDWVTGAAGISVID
ncbi:MAG: hypothetical protein EXX96DRAFT_650920 [Benjaminiella poitrasii]|nr:MAG: hypothetical protein EXX96DRAFT_650920 [Benjaminiella poitrasii]